jgi:hypothetical protein
LLAPLLSAAPKLPLNRLSSLVAIILCYHKGKVLLFLSCFGDKPKGKLLRVSFLQRKEQQAWKGEKHLAFRRQAAGEWIYRRVEIFS